MGVKSIERELMNQLQENQLAKKAIILYFDSSYCEQAIVTIKYLCVLIGFLVYDLIQSKKYIEK